MDINWDSTGATMLTYLQAHHLDLGFSDQHFGPGAYLDTHRERMRCRHGHEGVIFSEREPTR